MKEELFLIFSFYFVRPQALARQLQELEGNTLSQEEKDRLVAMEAQDKELARMLQERVCCGIEFDLQRHNLTK